MSKATERLLTQYIKGVENETVPEIAVRLFMKNGHVIMGKLLKKENQKTEWERLKAKSKEKYTEVSQTVFEDKNTFLVFDCLIQAQEHKYKPDAISISVEDILFWSSIGPASSF